MPWHLAWDGVELLVGKARMIHLGLSCMIVGFTFGSPDEHASLFPHLHRNFVLGDAPFVMDANSEPGRLFPIFSEGMPH